MSRHNNDQYNNYRRNNNQNMNQQFNSGYSTPNSFLPPPPTFEGNLQENYGGNYKRFSQVNKQDVKQQRFNNYQRPYQQNARLNSHPYGNQGNAYGGSRRPFNNQNKHWRNNDNSSNSYSQNHNNNYKNNNLQNRQQQSIPRKHNLNVFYNQNMKTDPWISSGLLTEEESKAIDQNFQKLKSQSESQ